MGCSVFCSSSALKIVTRGIGLLLWVFALCVADATRVAFALVAMVVRRCTEEALGTCGKQKRNALTSQISSQQLTWAHSELSISRVLLLPMAANGGACAFLPELHYYVCRSR
eukprot:5934898-Amphidinium_carterae.1